MKRINISEMINNINLKYVDEAIAYTEDKKKAAHRTGWRKWGVIAACFVLVAVLGIGIVQSSKPYTVTLNNGNQIIFFKGDNGIANSDMALAGIRGLTKTEASEIFGDMDVDAYVGFEENTNDFIYLEGKIDDFKLLVLRSDISPDTIFVGSEYRSTIDGVSVLAGHGLANNQGNKVAIVYASFEVGNYTIYLETAGNKSEIHDLCNALAEEIQKLIKSANLDFEIIR